jgi:predicted NAD/FAD-binding protein
MGRLKIAVAGTGISGLAAAWLLSQRHAVTVYDRANRIGGHSNTILARIGGEEIPVDVGFIVFNRLAYPNLIALFERLKVPTARSAMSLAISLNGGAFEYSGHMPGLFGQPANLLRRRFWSMLFDIRRFYQAAGRHVDRLDEQMSLGDYVQMGQYSDAFLNAHLLPMAAAIWSAPPREILSYPAASFLRFYNNHGLLRLRRRPAWQTVVGGSCTYVERLCQRFWRDPARDSRGRCPPKRTGAVDDRLARRLRTI